MINSYEDLKRHLGHDVQVVSYGAEKDDEGNPTAPANVAIECEDCMEILVSYDKAFCVHCSDKFELDDAGKCSNCGQYPEK